MAGWLRRRKFHGKKGDETESDFTEPCRQLCAHYSRGCSFVSPCCGKVYPCRLCHDDSETHKIDRFSVTEIVCRKCSTKQPVAGLCRQCGMNFGRYFCSICRLFDNDTSKGQFHCEKCGLCRIGGKEQVFHCDGCGFCMEWSLRISHTCRKGASKYNCPVCLEDIHSSRIPAHFPKCGHMIHNTCYQQMLQNGPYQCPLCYQSPVAALPSVVDHEKLQDELKADNEGLKAELGVYQQQAMQYREQKENIQGDCVRLQQQLQRQEEEAAQQSQLLQQRLDATLAEVQHLRLSPQIAPKSHKPWNIPRQEVEIFDEIGRGAWGTVAKGKFKGQSVAVKCLHPEILNEHTIERLQREVQIMAQVRHPNLLHFIGAVFDSQQPHKHPPLIILELLDVNLRMAYQTKRLQVSSKIPIFRDIAYALHYLHEHHEPIIHRDVSAPNVLLQALPSGMWRAKVSDFGSANLARLAKTMGEGAIIYAAPETFPRNISTCSPPPPQTTKIDVFSYGVLLCEVITSQMPNPERFWIMLKQVQQQWPLMHQLILSCINENADKRPTMAEVLDQLNVLQLKPN